MTAYRWRMLCRPISVAHHEAGHAVAAQAVSAPDVQGGNRHHKGYQELPGLYWPP